MNAFMRFASLLLLLAVASATAADKAGDKHALSTCADCGTVLSITPVRGPSVSPGGARGGGVGGTVGGAAGGVLGGRSAGGPGGSSGGMSGSGQSWDVLVQMDTGGTRNVTVRDLDGLERRDKVRVTGFTVERIQD